MAAAVALAITSSNRRATPVLIAHPIEVSASLPAGGSAGRTAPVAAGTSGRRLAYRRHRLASSTALPAEADARAESSAAEIIIDQREVRAIRSLIDSLQVGRADLAPLLDASTTAFMDAAPVREIYIAPIDLSPLTGGKTDKGVPE